MTRSSIFLLAVLLAPLCGTTQVASIKEASMDRTFRGWRHTVVNNGSSSIMAIHATFACTNEKGFHYKDNIVLLDFLISERNKKIAQPGDSLAVYSSDQTPCPGGVDAVIFSDGHSEGDKQLIDEIYQRRLGTYNALADIVKLLDNIATQGATPIDVIKMIENRSHSINQDMTLSRSEKQGMDYIYWFAIQLLQDQNDFRAPSGPSANHRPDIGEIMKTKNVSRQQAHAIVITAKFQEWRSALEGHTAPPGVK